MASCILGWVNNFRVISQHNRGRRFKLLLPNPNMDSSPIDVLPKELIEVILSTCPVKQVIVLKSVSKSWQSIISSPSFSAILQSKFYIWDSNPLLLLYLIRSEKDGKFEIVKISRHMKPFASSVKPLCSCNGLILLKKESPFASKQEYMLWNPFMMKHIMIEPYNQVFLPPPHTRHLYYDSTADDYKIVSVYDECYAVYSFNKKTWGKLEDCRSKLSLKDCEAVEGCFYRATEEGKIMCYDFVNQQLHEFRQPDEVKTLDRVVLKATLDRQCLYGFSRDGDERLQLWVMEKNGRFENSWKKLISMEKAEPNMSNPRPVCVTKEDNVILRAKDQQYGNYRQYLYTRSNCRFQGIDYFGNDICST